MTRDLIEGITTWLNNFPPTNGVSRTLSPSTIVLGKAPPDASRKRISFGSYAMVYIGTTNRMKARSVPGIALRESNQWGGQYFMSLYTGKRLHSFKWQELPIDQDVIDRVEQLAKMEGQPIMPGNFPLFEWSPGVTILDDGEDDVPVDEPADDQRCSCSEQFLWLLLVFYVIKNILAMCHFEEITLALFLKPLKRLMRNFAKLATGFRNLIFKMLPNKLTLF